MYMFYVDVINIHKPMQKKDWFSDNDLFVVLHYGSEKRRTNVIYDKKTPVFNEAFVFNVCDDDEMIIEVYEQGQMGVNRLASYPVKVHYDKVKYFETKCISLRQGLIFSEYHTAIECQREKLKELQNDIELLHEKSKRIV